MKSNWYDEERTPANVQLALTFVKKYIEQPHDTF